VSYRTQLAHTGLRNANSLSLRLEIDHFIVPEPVLHHYFQLTNSFSHSRDWKSMEEQELWHELCLCILSSNVPYEMAKSALVHLSSGNLLDYTQIAHELAKPIYLPKKKDGSFRKYRFPNVRATNIVNAGRFLSSEKNGITHILCRFDSDIETREFLIEHIPGIGLKEASHFLRNIKYSDSLAIIDSHIVTFLEETLLEENIPVRSINPRVYVMLEGIMRSIARNNGLNLSILDMAIWQYMKNK